MLLPRDLVSEGPVISALGFADQGDLVLVIHTYKGPWKKLVKTVTGARRRRRLGGSRCNPCEGMGFLQPEGAAMKAHYTPAPDARLTKPVDPGLGRGYSITKNL